MNVIIVEDELPARQQLIELLMQVDDSVKIAATFESISDTVSYFKHAKEPDLVFMDIQLTDGLSFEIFRKIELQCPVMFVTAFDEYLQQAFENNGIEYLLKPVKLTTLQRALKKFNGMKDHFVHRFSYETLVNLPQKQETTIKRLITQKGGENLILPVEEIAYIFTEHKMLFVTDQNGNRSTMDESLSALENKLPSAMFFRLNRKYVANIKAISRFKTLEKSRVQVYLLPPVNEEVIVSQENAREFKKWISGAD